MTLNQFTFINNVNVVELFIKINLFTLLWRNIYKYIIINIQIYDEMNFYINPFLIAIFFLEILLTFLFC